MCIAYTNKFRYFDNIFLYLNKINMFIILVLYDNKVFDFMTISEKFYPSLETAS